MKVFHKFGANHYKSLKAYAFFTVLKIVFDRRGEEKGELACLLPAITLCDHLLERTFVVFGFWLAGYM